MTFHRIFIYLYLVYILYLVCILQSAFCTRPAVCILYWLIYAHIICSSRKPYWKIFTSKTLNIRKDVNPSFCFAVLSKKEGYKYLSLTIFPQNWWKSNLSKRQVTDDLYLPTLLTLALASSQALPFNTAIPGYAWM